MLWLNALWALPILTFLVCRHHVSRRVFGLTGASVGLVVAPASLGLYGLYFVGPLAALLGLLGLVLVLFHGRPGYELAIRIGVVPPATVVRGVEHVYIAILNAGVWSIVYGVIGHSIDRIRQRKRAA